MRIFTDDGDAVPVTVLDVSDNRVTQVKTDAVDGYSAIQVAFRFAQGVPRQQAGPGHLAKAGVFAGEVLRSSASPRSRCQYKPGATLPVTPVRRRPDGRRAGHLDRQRASPAPSSATTSARSARRTATAVRTTCRARSRWRRIRAACSRQEDDRPHGRRDRHHPEPGRRAHRRGAFAAAGRGAVPGAKGHGGWSCARRSGRPSRALGPVMQLELLNDQGQATRQGGCAGHGVRARLQRSAGASGGGGLQANARQGTRAQRTAPRSSTRRRSRSARRAPAARAGMTRPADLAWGWSHLPEHAGRELLHKVNKKMYRAGMASILSQLARDGRLAVVDASRSTRRRPSCWRRSSRRWAWVGDGHRRPGGREPGAGVAQPGQCAGRRAALRRPLSLVFYKKVLVTRGAIEQLKEMYA